jgi:hypothetical protein
MVEGRQQPGDGALLLLGQARQEGDQFLIGHLADIRVVHFHAEADPARGWPVSLGRDPL